MSEFLVTHETYGNTEHAIQVCPLAITNEHARESLCNLYAETVLLCTPVDSIRRAQQLNRHLAGYLQHLKHPIVTDTHTGVK
ncbi:hypothetical protein DPMN_129204 [Dreissena polymorpha]|uniref:Uncharacterized protein n=1 Tax=Dreissena polymorpha TaxID=45954 RepID=A0A9D4H282_DREPO|nr:hypothetical protein DPMN_129204 [Dreissena polymorpha]